MPRHLSQRQLAQRHLCQYSICLNSICPNSICPNTTNVSMPFVPIRQMSQFHLSQYDKCLNSICPNMTVVSNSNCPNKTIGLKSWAAEGWGARRAHQPSAARFYKTKQCGFSPRIPHLLGFHKKRKG